jgi:hypothetical protein
MKWTWMRDSTIVNDIVNQPEQINVKSDFKEKISAYKHKIIVI